MAGVLDPQTFFESSSQDLKNREIRINSLWDEISHFDTAFKSKQGAVNDSWEE